MCIAGQRAPMLVESFSLANFLSQDNNVQTVPSGSLKKSHAHITVHHDYHDHSNETECQSSSDLFRASGGSPSFPYKLYDMLSRVDAEGHSHIVSWQPHGRCFVVHKPEEFKKLLAHYFNGVSKLPSFSRQLNLYSFQRITKGPDRSGYYHECFLRGKPTLLSQIRRMKVKGTGVRARSNPEAEPDFYNMPWVSGKSSSSVQQQQQQQQEQQTTVVPMSASSVVSHDETCEQVMEQQQVSMSSDIVTGWGKQFHYLDLIAAGSCTPQPEAIDQDLMNDTEFEKELDALLIGDKGDFDLLSRLERLVDGDDLSQFEW